MYHFTYQTKNLLNDKLYIGVHSTDDLNDGYIGCGCYKHKINNKTSNSPLPKAMLKHGTENFSMIPLCFFDTDEEAYEEEEWIANENWVKRRDTYNARVGGRGGSHKSDWTEERRRKTAINRVYTTDKRHNLTILGVHYNSKRDAAEAFGITLHFVYKIISGMSIKDAQAKSKTIYKRPNRRKYKD